ncbi:MAG: hypothetical protein P8020_22200, partial [Acidobacteriota bacterium]
VLYLADVLNLGRTYDRIATAFAQAQEEGLLKHEMGFEEPFLVWPVVLRDYLDAFRSGYVAESPTAVLKDLESMLRESVYSITDKRVFDEPPANETDVHNRMEAVLRCVFPDLKRKPSLSKAIKNFEPDTGLPSIQTLIEYKFVSKNDDVKRVADEILADTRGYVSETWSRFVYLIYETSPICSETQWNQLFVECRVRNTKAIVISGARPEQK